MNDDLITIRTLAAGNRFEEASEACRSYLASNPNDPTALNFMAGIACQLNRYDEAIDVMEKLVNILPADAGLNKNLGYLYSLVDRDDDAIARYEQAASANPNDVDTLNRVAMLHLRRGNADAALSTLASARRIQPNHAPTRSRLGETLYRLGNLSEASSEYQTALRLTPSDPVATNGLAAVFMAQGKHEHAIRLLEPVLNNTPAFAEAEINLAISLTFVGRAEEAVAHGQKAVALKPESVAAHSSLAAAFRDAGQAEKAADAYATALQFDANNREARVGLGSTLVDLGRFDEAVEHLEQAIKIDPNCGTAYYHLAELARHHKVEFSEEQMADLDARAKNEAISADDRSAMRFSRAISFERQKRSSEAFAEYALGNEAIHAWLAQNGTGFDVARHHKFIDDIIATFDTSFLERDDLHGSPDETPVFVVGMPRSGTTLIEQIIASHPQAAGAGELSTVHRLAQHAPLDRPGSSVRSFPDNASQLTSEALGKHAASYLDRLRQVDETAARIVDKMWANFLYVGFLAVLFPKARFIHARRNLMDVGLSCYCRRLVSVNLPWAWNLTEIGTYAREYLRIMRHWSEVMPDRIFEVRYEELVEDQEATSRGLIDFCGLEWSEQCIRFYESDRSIQTHSRVQVRQPIYRTSKEKWRQFETELEPLRQALDNGT